MYEKGTERVFWRAWQRRRRKRKTILSFHVHSTAPRPPPPVWAEKRSPHRTLVFVIMLLVLPGFIAVDSQLIPIDWNSVPLSPSLRDTQTELGTCECDLTSSSCDPNCCCDPDCPPPGAAQSALFSGPCLPEGPQPARRPYCPNYLVSINSRLTNGKLSPTAVADKTGMLCIVIENVPAASLFYSAPTVVDNPATFAELYARESSSTASTYTLGLFAELNLPPPPRAAYKVGSPIQLSFSGSLRGYLPLPAASITGACIDDVPAKFLMRESRRCIRVFADPRAACAAGGLDWHFYLGGYTIISETSLSAPAVVTPVVSTPLCEDSATLQVSPCCVVLATKSLATCGTAGATNDFSTLLNWGALGLPTPALGSDGICRNAVIGVKYKFKITQPAVNTSGGATAASINDVQITLTYGEVGPSASTADPVSVLQTFEGSYVSADVANEALVYSRSGAPGYNLGSPVLFGSLVTNNDGKKAIQISQAPLTLTRPHPVTGDCLVDSAADVALRTPVTFGEDTVTGCALTLSRADLASSCDTIRARVLRMQLGAYAAQGLASGGLYVSMWGSSDVGNVKEWVQIQGVDKLPTVAGLTAEPADSSGTCNRLVTELSIEFLWVDSGSITNPQPTIVGARIVASATGSFAPSCGSGGMDACRGNTSKTLTFFVRSTVTFVRSPATAIEEVWPPPPRMGSLLPADVFYPFRMSLASKTHAEKWLAAVGLAAVVIMAQ